MQEQIVRDASNSVSQASNSIDMITERVEAISTTVIYTERVQNYLHNVYAGIKNSRAELFALEQGLAVFYDNALMRSMTLYDTAGNYTHYPIGSENDFYDDIRNAADFGYHAKWIGDADTNLMHLIRPIESSRNFDRLGFFDIVLYADIFAQPLKELDFGTDGMFAVFDENMQRITGNANMISASLIDDIAAGRNNSVIKIEGRDYFVFYRTSDSTRWTTVGCISRSVIYDGIQKIMLIVFLLVFAIIAAAMWISFLFSQYSVRRINRLISAMHAFSNGDLSVRIMPDENPEFKELGSCFNDMVKRIESLIDSEYRVKLLKNQAELRMLEAQINPHFLYNTLNVLYWKAQMTGQDDIAQITVSLANLFHASIDRTIDFITLGEELNNIDDYIYIQKMRFRDKVQVHIAVSDALKSYLVPKLVLQPIVENAFIHGMEPKAGSGTIGIAFEDMGCDVVVTVSDDGVGMDAETAGRALIERQGKKFQGLLNVHKRLQLYYGQDYGLSVASTAGVGTVVTMRLRKENEHVPRNDN
ncbi:sensor histidine kinase [Treponema socranskii]|uniref:sensor histidine kinase n=1 Tax=Treponema socranskii TaxID=53419 RepID=UPI003D90C87D